MADHPLDMLIVGAGLAGLGVAQHLQAKVEGARYQIIEARDRIGGTWDFFKYPGLRSDVDMHLYGYSFKPWTDGVGVASAANILSYLEETADEFGLREHIRFQTRVTAADFDPASALWTVHLQTPDGPETVQARWLQLCGGYYSYEAAHRPTFEGEDVFAGDILHTQDWPAADGPDRLDLAGKRVVVVGSGATAVTLLPALAESAAHVTQLQRSPTYVFAGPREPLGTRLLRALLPGAAGYHAVRRKNLLLDRYFRDIIHNKPAKFKRLMRKAAMKHLPADFDYDTHFTPAYPPGEQRICFAPDGDFFEALARPNTDIVTDHIERFTETGIQLRSGAHLEADLIVLATGLKMKFGNGVALSVDGSPVNAPDTWLYKGVMFSGVPNMSIAVGSLIHSYTLRVEAMAAWVCRVLDHMRRTGTHIAVPELPLPEADMPRLPFTEEFSSGYVTRAIDQFPATGEGEPWVNQQAYADSLRLYGEPLEDGALTFRKARKPARTRAAA